MDQSRFSPTTSPSDYVDAVWMLSKGNRPWLWPLAKFLRKRSGGEANDGNANNGTILTSEISSRQFAWYFEFGSSNPSSPCLNPSPSSSRTWAFAPSCNGKLVFLRGHPSQEWLRTIGNAFDIIPEYWQRHLDYLSPSGSTLIRNRPLPSSPWAVFQLRVGTVGTMPRFHYHQHSTETLRRIFSSSMTNYHKTLTTGEGWRQGDSVIRRYIMHDKDHFSIEQQVTVFLCYPKNVENWTVVVMLDCSDDLRTSPRGPWENGRICEPSTIVHGSWSSQGYSMNTNVTETAPPSFPHGPPIDPTQLLNDGSPHTIFPQSLSRVHLRYGSGLQLGTTVDDPFYALTSIFQEDIMNESHTLDMIADKVKRYVVGTDSITMQLHDLQVAQSQLLHFQDFLEDRSESIEHKRDLIQRRGGISWPPLRGDQNNTVILEAASSLISDLEHLNYRARQLLGRIERSIYLVKSLISVEEARRGASQNKMLFRLTLVASVFIPLSFTTSFFGMNFREFGTGSLNLWIFFVVSAPVFLISALCLFMRGHWLKSLSRGIKGMF